ncbi:beta-glucosidase BglX [Paenibacillus lutimineralis]|uniref:Beta-glucosidase BglX n=2 Tax=Paenibacillus lutimineralis TaxID=2707005 RepID=A0A3S9UU88_9BACL|nr:beta-glucosidase BglX [Paenibacillus lutimineralis]AZS13876.1 beta-glucosidase BglX [Paenibacillus lutimineralis]
MTSQRISQLVKEMTLEEKAAQLLQLAATFYEDGDGQITGPMESLGIGEMEVNYAGSVLGISEPEKIIQIQQAYLAKNRLGIPLLFMADIIHGFKTIFPIPLAMGSSWDLEMAERSAEVAAKEAAVSGVHVTFAPMADLVRDPRWGRVMESTGEDPYLNALFARAMVRGFQGENLTHDTDRVAACVKHFAAYGLAEGGRDYNTVDLSERSLREYYLPAYKAALEEGCEMVMTSFNTIDSIPASGNRKLMRDLLRGEWGFNGVLISDWGAIGEMIPHGVAEDEREAALKAIIAGVDIEMMTPTYVHHIPQLVAEGRVDEALVDEAVTRILELKEKLGLFDNPLRGADPEAAREVVYCDEHRRIAQELAAKSCVLLKNEGVLPLRREQKVAVIGPFVQSGDILGSWSWAGSRETAVQLGAAMQKLASSDLITLAEGSDIISVSKQQLQQAEAAAQEADVIVLALGEASEMSGEASSRSNIQLPEAQLELIQAMKRLGKPIAVVLFNGRPLDLHGVIDQADAVLEAWFPGSEGGAAVADLLYGVVNPSGKLTMSFPYAVGQIPVYYNHYNTGRPKPAEDTDEQYVSKYLDIPNAPLLPFGYGLSYTTFEYSSLELSSEVMTPEETIKVSVQVRNTGKVKGIETVQLYVRDISGEVVRPMRELKDFRKVELAPGEAARVVFELGEKQLRYYHSDLSFTSEAGKFEVFVGPNSRDTLQAGFRLNK